VRVVREAYERGNEMTALNTSDQYSDAVVDRVVIRGHDAIQVKFPLIPGVTAYFIADPGNDYWCPQVITILQKDDDLVLDDYIYHGQDGYGSDPIVRSETGYRFYPRLIEFGVVDQGDLLDADDAVEVMMDSGSDPLSVTREGRNADEVILEAVASTDVGSQFLRKHVGE